MFSYGILQKTYGTETLVPLPESHIRLLHYSILQLVFFSLELSVQFSAKQPLWGKMRALFTLHIYFYLFIFFSSSTPFTIIILVVSYVK